MDSPVNSRNHQIANIGTLSIVRLCQANAESIMTNEIAFSQLATLGLFTCWSVAPHAPARPTILPDANTLLLCFTTNYQLPMQRNLLLLKSCQRNLPGFDCHLSQHQAYFFCLLLHICHDTFPAYIIQTITCVFKSAAIILRRVSLTSSLPIKQVFLEISHVCSKSLQTLVCHLTTANYA